VATGAGFTCGVTAASCPCEQSWLVQSCGMCNQNNPSKKTKRIAHDKKKENNKYIDDKTTVASAETLPISAITEFGTVSLMADSLRDFSLGDCNLCKTVIPSPGQIIKQ